MEKKKIQVVEISSWIRRVILLSWTVDINCTQSDSKVIIWTSVRFAKVTEHAHGELGGTKTMLHVGERRIPSWPLNLSNRRCLTSANTICRGTRIKIIEVSWTALMEICSEKSKGEVAEGAERVEEG